MIPPKTHIAFLLISLCCFTLPIDAQTGKNLQKQDKLRSPETFDEAVTQTINLLDENSKSLIHGFPRELLFSHWGRLGFGVINKYQLIAGNPKLLASCAQKLGSDHIGYEKAFYLITQAVYDRLNPEIAKIDYSNLKPGDYFDVIWNDMQKTKQESNPACFAALPVWIYQEYSNRFPYMTDENLLKAAITLAQSGKEHAFLGLLYASHDFQSRDQIIGLLDQKFNANAFVEMPYYEIPRFNESATLWKNKTKIKGSKNKTHYSWKKIQTKDFILKCYGLLYEKEFKNAGDYLRFKTYCEQNELAKWKFQKSLAKNDFEVLIKTPRKLLEILILTNNRYYHYRSSEHNLIDGANDNIDDLIQLLRTTDTISEDYPYHERFRNFAYDNDTIANIEVNALSLIAGKMSMAEILDILNPKSIQAYNRTTFTEDFLAYNYFIGFIIASQYKRILNHPDKKATWEICNYYRKNEYLSWALYTFMAELMMQIDKDKSLPLFKKSFPENPVDGSSDRHNALNAIIQFDFENNRDFIEHWYWKIHGKTFENDISPGESRYILNLLQEKDQATLALYHKIATDPRFKQ